MKKLLKLLFTLSILASCEPVLAQTINCSQIKKRPLIICDGAYLSLDTTTYLATQYDLSQVTASATWGTITGTLSAQTDLQTALNAKLNISDTASMLSPYLKSATASATYATISNLALKVNISDTAAMLGPYLKSATAASTYYPLSNPSGYTSNAGTVTSVSVTTANGVSGSVATATTTPAITLTLGAITPTTVNGVTVSGSGSLANTGATSLTGFTGSGSSSGTNTGDQVSYLQLSNTTAASAINSTVYFGNFYAEGFTAIDSLRITPVTRACTIKEVTFFIYATTAGTNVATYSVDVVTTANAHTSTALGSFALNRSIGITRVTYTGLSISVGATDGFQIKVALPNSGTAPTGVRYTATVAIQ